MAFWQPQSVGPAKRIQATHVVWMTRESKCAGIVADLTAQLAEAGAIVLVTHFTDTLAELARRLDQEGLPWEPLTTSPLRDHVRPGPAGRANVYLMHSDLLAAEDLPAETRTGQEPVAVVVAEMHASEDRCARVGWFAHALPYRTSLRHHFSLDEPFLRLFGGETSAHVLAALGVREGDSICHPLLDKAIERARTKIVRTAISDQPAETAESGCASTAPPSRAA